MRREDKYPTTDVFQFYNVNPRGRLTEDCVIRAITAATGKDYNDVVMETARLQCETGYQATGVKGLANYMERIGWVKCQQPRKADNTKYTGEEFCRYLTKYSKSRGSMIANIGGNHTVAILYIDGHFKVVDTWDSSDGCIGNYWVQK